MSNDNHTKTRDSCVAIIPARGGSKRIPRKNIREFAGKPVIAYSIAAAKESGLFEEVMVSTDDDEIADIARHYGAAIPFRREAATAGDLAGTAEVLTEVLRNYAALGRTFNIGCCLYPVAPFITPDLLRRGHDLLFEKGFASVFPVVRLPAQHQRSLQMVGECVSMLRPEKYVARSQDFPPAFYDASQFYWFRSAPLFKEMRLYTAYSGAIVLSEMQAHDVDSLDDWAVAEFKFRYIQAKAVSDADSGKVRHG